MTTFFLLEIIWAFCTVLYVIIVTSSNFFWLNQINIWSYFMYFFVLFHLVHIYYFIVLSCSYILLNIFILFYSLFICLTRLSKALVIHVSCWNEDGDRMLFILGFLKSSSSLIAESEETLVFFIYYVCGILRLDIYIWGGGLTSSLFIMTAI